MTQRCGCRHLSVTRLISRPDELEAMTTSPGNVEPTLPTAAGEPECSASRMRSHKPRGLEGDAQGSMQLICAEALL
jgi:hypothetical protein